MTKKKTKQLDECQELAIKIMECIEESKINIEYAIPAFGYLTGYIMSMGTNKDLELARTILNLQRTSVLNCLANKGWE